MIHPSPNRPITSVHTVRPVVALTFDDGPHPTQTPFLLEFFAREGVRVTFFEIGDKVAAHPELARAILAAGHEIGNHSKTHPRLGEMSDRAAVRAELVETQSILSQATGRTPTLFRAPYISHGPVLGSVLEELGLPSIGGAYTASDWHPDATVDSICANCLQAKAGDILILHTWPEKTAEALPRLLRGLREKGLTPVTVSELLAHGLGDGD